MTTRMRGNSSLTGGGEAKWNLLFSFLSANFSHIIQQLHSYIFLNGLKTHIHILLHSNYIFEKNNEKISSLHNML